MSLNKPKWLIFSIFVHKNGFVYSIELIYQFSQHFSIHKRKKKAQLDMYCKHDVRVNQFGSVSRISLAFFVLEYIYSWHFVFEANSNSDGMLMAPLCHLNTPEIQRDFNISGELFLFFLWQTVRKANRKIIHHKPFTQWYTVLFETFTLI